MRRQITWAETTRSETDIELLQVVGVDGIVGWVSGTIFDTTSSMRSERAPARAYLHARMNAGIAANLSELAAICPSEQEPRLVLVRLRGASGTDAGSGAASAGQPSRDGESLRGTSAAKRPTQPKLTRSVSEGWLGGRDSNPDTVVQSHVSYR
jgi:hypothetical protein